MVNDIGCIAGLPWVAIPSCGQSEHLIPLVKSLSADIGVCVIINNVTDKTALSIMADVVEAGGHVYMWPGEANIYQMWNWSIKQGLEQNCSSVAILNDDVKVNTEDVLIIDGHLRDNANLAICGWDWQAIGGSGLRYVEGSLRKGGVGGFAFAVDPRLVPFVDERFTWWGGDDDLFYGTASKGHRLALALGTRVLHHTSTTANKLPSAYNRVDEDRALLLSKWGDTW